MRQAEQCRHFECEDEMRGGDGQEVPQPGNKIFSCGKTF